MTDDQQDGPSSRALPRTTRLVVVLVSAMVIGAAFGALTSLVNGLSESQADFENAAFTTSGWSYPEILAVLLDSGWAWAGSAVAVSRLLTRTVEGRSAALARGGAAGVLTLLGATAAYCVVDTIRHGGPLSSWYLSEPYLWWVAAVVLGAPLGAVGVWCGRPGVLGILARLTVPVGAVVETVVMPRGRNEVVTTIGQAVVWPLAAIAVAVVLVPFLKVKPDQPSPAGPELP